MMRKRLSTVAVALALLLGVHAIRPAKAHAIDEWGWAGIAVGAYAVFIVVCTALIFGDYASEGEEPISEAEREQRPVNLGPQNCGPQSEGRVALACW